MEGLLLSYLASPGAEVLLEAGLEQPLCCLLVLREGCRLTAQRKCSGTAGVQCLPLLGALNRH